MQYKVTGARRDTGLPTEIEIEAASRDDAEARANSRGVLVDSIEPQRSALWPLVLKALRIPRDAVAIRRLYWGVAIVLATVGLVVETTARYDEKENIFAVLIGESIPHDDVAASHWDAVLCLAAAAVVWIVGRIHAIEQAITSKALRSTPDIPD